MGRSPGRGPCTLGRPPPVNQEENRRWGWLIYSHPSTSVLNTRAMRKGNTAWFQRGLGRVSEHPCPRCPPLYRGAHVHPMGSDVRVSLFLSWSFPQPPHPTLPGPWSFMSESAGGREKVGPYTWDRSGSPASDPGQGSVWAALSMELPPNGETQRPRCSPPRTAWREVRRGPAWRGAGLAVRSLSGGWHRYFRTAAPPGGGPRPRPAQACAAPSAGPESTAAPGSRHRRTHWGSKEGQRCGNTEGEGCWGAGSGREGR